jgi:hypothetical protein
MRVAVFVAIFTTHSASAIACTGVLKHVLLFASAHLHAVLPSAVTGKLGFPTRRFV